MLKVIVNAVNGFEGKAHKKFRKILKIFTLNQ